MMSEINMDSDSDRRRGQSLFVLPDTDSSSREGSGPSRRDFLVAAGFAFAGVCVPGCYRAPVKEDIPLLYQPEGMVPGVPAFYASTCDACSASCGILVKNNDGRPTKLEGDPAHPISKGGLCAAGQASILGLYDRLRPQHPSKDGKELSWEEIDRSILNEIEAIRHKGSQVRVLSGTITSPTTKDLIQKFLASFGQNGRHVVYDAFSSSAILDAHERTHGSRLLPQYHFDRADLIVGFDADFLGTWISPVEFTAGYRAKRIPRSGAASKSFHIQVESRLSLTGTKADERICVTPAEMQAMLRQIAVAIGARKSVQLSSTGEASSNLSNELKTTSQHLAERLWQARGRSLAVCGSQDIPSQVLCNFINHALGNYGSTVDAERPSFQRAGADGELASLLHDLREGKVAGLFLIDCNPVADLPDGEQLARALKQVGLVVSCSQQDDETARVSRYACPHPHYLESWSDAEPVSGIASLRQPTIHRLGKTRPLMESLAVWSGKPKAAYDILREHWQRKIFPRSGQKTDFQTFWEHAVHEGHVEVAATPLTLESFAVPEAQKALEATVAQHSGLALVLHANVGMRDGSHAYNPWLQELPDPISKVTWDNYASISPKTAIELALEEGDVVHLQMGGGKNQDQALDLPVYIQPGQNDRVVAVALGYGRITSSRFKDIGPEWLEARPTLGEDGRVGKNAAPFISWNASTLCYVRSGLEISRTSAKRPLASTQAHYILKVPEHLAPQKTDFKAPIQETTLAALTANTKSSSDSSEKPTNLWPADHPYPGHRWGMVIDLQACTGCSACVIACQSENNVPVVGRDEVLRRREMHWLRIDRYAHEDGEHLNVDYQPMLCQHCEQAPCETVCPVLATVHSSDGLNEQVYNRCVGTRYCANNCPYKVRRFNWFAYAHEDALQNMSLNPDVTVRSRGVMEKCTFCVQRIENAKINAKQRGEAIRDGELQTACQQSCPAKAIVFGDLNDRNSEVARKQQDARRYQVLGELNIGPSVSYLKVIRDRPTTGKG
jgi:molybdopterin-containing oxidoreductase family iron-sulfur binding subunit